jgi:serine/threonine-protein kinase HipA
MSALTLDVRLDGYEAPIGKLISTASDNVAFTYSTEHLAITNALPLSLSFPLRDEPYGDVATRSFFSNLLQERDQPRGHGEIWNRIC